MSLSLAGPLGVLPGMTFDPVRNRYFPLPKDVAAQPQSHHRKSSPMSSSSASILPRTKCLDDGAKTKRARMDDRREVRSVVPADRLPGQRRMQLRGRRDVAASSESSIYASFSEHAILRVGSCGGEKVLSFRSCNGGAFWATTDHGKVIFHKQNGDSQGIAVCAANIVGLHCDIPRLVMMAVSGGAEPHVHCFQRPPNALERDYMNHQDAQLPSGEVFAVSSYDDVCNVGGQSCFSSVTYPNRLNVVRRRMPSDVLALHQAERNIVFAGLRSGVVSLEDMRVAPRGIHRVGGTRKGKAIVGVKRLRDSAVPWGLLVSGMGDELLVYDVRFNRQPLFSLNGHVNSFMSKLGLGTSPDGTHIFAAGSDRRVRLWHLPTGQRIHAQEPIHPGPFYPPPPRPPSHPSMVSALHAYQARIGPRETNPLRRTFSEVVDNICVRHDHLGLDLTVGGEIQRFTRDAADDLRQVVSDDEDLDMFE